jgi:hypothetical protein
LSRGHGGKAWLGNALWAKLRHNRLIAALLQSQDEIQQKSGMHNDRKFWFPAKRYGWGWGLPVRWQGWLVLVVFLASIVAGSLTLLPRYGALVFYAYAAFISAAFLVVLWLTGEPPRWRWGGK